MKKINAGKYHVASGETITIEVTPVGVGPFVAAARDGEVLLPESGTEDTKPTFIFTVDSSSIVKMEFSFPGAPATARYDTAITSSEGGDPGGFTIKRNASIKDPNIRFIVVNPN